MARTVFLSFSSVLTRFVTTAFYIGDDLYMIRESAFRRISFLKLLTVVSSSKRAAAKPFPEIMMDTFFPSKRL
jgi:type IV secretory pathway VirB3-like protein